MPHEPHVAWKSVLSKQSWKILFRKQSNSCMQQFQLSATEHCSGKEKQWISRDQRRLNNDPFQCTDNNCLSAPPLPSPPPRTVVLGRLNRYFSFKLNDKVMSFLGSLLFWRRISGISILRKKRVLKRYSNEMSSFWLLPMHKYDGAKEV